MTADADELGRALARTLASFTDDHGWCRVCARQDSHDDDCLAAEYGA